MAQIKLEHYNLMTKRLRETVDFYVQVLGLYEGFYPVELGPGAWLYDSSDTPVVHMQEVTEGSFGERVSRTGGRIKDGRDGAPRTFDALYGSGTVDHIAFACQDIEGFKTRLARLDIPYGETGLDSATLRQLFLRDPNGIVVELNFRDKPAS
jgi:catechol 2,3-dioxygenase-like lactoylglutathione lyase family enzyme